jgi:hypothetical protein
MDFDAHTIDLAARAAGPDAMQALSADYHRKIVQFFGAWIKAKQAEAGALGGDITLSGPVRSMFEAISQLPFEAISQLPGFQIDRTYFEGLPIFDFDIETRELPTRASRLRFGDTWLVWKRPMITIAMEMLYRVNISGGPHWE